MWDAGTGRLHTTRDVTWMNKMYFEERSFNNPAPNEQVNNLYQVMSPTVTVYEGTSVTFEELPDDNVHDRE
jgi:hypothetical protein